VKTGAILVLLSGLVAASDDGLRNIDFSAGALTGWEGDGFSIVPDKDGQATGDTFVDSSDRETVGRTALVHRAITIPPGASAIRFRACAMRPTGLEPDDRLDVALLAAGKRLVPKHVWDGKRWSRADRLLAADRGLPREYMWSLKDYAGQTVRIALVDDDPRPNCYVRCSGFQIVANAQAQNFGNLMVRLAQQHNLPPMAQYDTAHFVAMSNAEEGLTRMELRNCESMFTTFFDHFRAKGFEIREPGYKLPVAILDSQSGFEAYLGHKMSPLIRGFYQMDTNRFVMYDYGQNDAWVAFQRTVEKRGSQINGIFDRQRYRQSVRRQTQDFRNDANTSTVMHEVSHQLAYNCGLLNRDVQPPPWLAEGMACYCESTANGAWQGLGEANVERLKDLASLQRAGELVSVRELVRTGRWLSSATEQHRLIAYYAQSWALFRMLMEEEPAGMRTFLSLIYNEHAPERFLAHFQQAFGADLSKMERRHSAYIRNELAVQSK
jgi:hypothetical protein